jgi:hypothetical protein
MTGDVHRAARRIRAEGEDALVIVSAGAEDGVEDQSRRPGKSAGQRANHGNSRRTLCFLVPGLIRSLGVKG